ncbi:MAG: DUF4013 domain-containing protein, partial [Methanobrevibacter sp.]|nr:DUF4013 domain-containing protein [Methanobrevibacter sp.]
SITKNTVHNNENFPDFKFLDNFVDGIKIIIIHVIYSIIPSILLFIIGIASIGLNQDVMSSLNSPEQLLNNVGLISQILVFFVLSFILYGIFSLLSVMGTMIFAKTGNFWDAFKFKELFNRISSIGILRYIILIIVLDIILVLISFIGGFINLIPFIGTLIFMILLFPYMLICYYRVIGLIYNESETESLQSESLQDIN